jgi:hypothetical protein
MEIEQEVKRTDRLESYGLDVSPKPCCLLCDLGHVADHSVPEFAHL